MTQNAKAAGVRPHGKPLLKRIWDYRMIYLMLLPTVLYFVLFKCRAVWGMKLAFFDYRPRGEDVWAGLKYFRQVFSSPTFGTIILNTVKISLMRTLLNWFFPVVFALMQHEVRRSGFRKTVQVVSYLPHFLSWVVIYGIWKGALDYGGMLNGIWGWSTRTCSCAAIPSWGSSAHRPCGGASAGTPSSTWRRFSPSIPPCLTPPPWTAPPGCRSSCTSSCPRWCPPWPPS